jgi:hypothetical protein
MGGRKITILAVIQTADGKEAFVASPWNIRGRFKMSLDMRTIVFSNMVTDIVCMVVILVLWHQSRERFVGTGFLLFDFAFQTVAPFLVILRGSTPDWISWTCMPSFSTFLFIPIVPLFPVKVKYSQTK